MLQPDGGFLEVAPASAPGLTFAKDAGAEIRIGERVHAVEPHPDGVRIISDRGTIKSGTRHRRRGAVDEIAAARSAGPLRVTRQVMGWFTPVEPQLVASGRFPAFLLESEHGIHYGFPPFGDAQVKIAKHHHNDETVDPDTYDRDNVSER